MPHITKERPVDAYKALTHEPAKTGRPRKGLWVNCERCGTEFWVRPSFLKLGRGRFCSKACQAKDQRFGAVVGKGRGGSTYGSEAQQVRRAADKPYRFRVALKALARHHANMSEERLEEHALRLLDKYLDREMSGTIVSLVGLDDPRETLTFEELAVLALVILWCEVLVLEGKFREVKPDVFEITEAGRDGG